MNKSKLFELQEIEYYEENWNHVGLFQTKELAEQFRDQRIAELKSSFDEEVGKFEDWFRWHISVRNFYKKDLEEGDVEAIHRLKTQSWKDTLNQYGDWDIQYITDLQSVSNLYFEENP